jgi:hypothetical protein
VEDPASIHYVPARAIDKEIFSGVDGKNNNFILNIEKFSASLRNSLHALLQL